MKIELSDLKYTMLAINRTLNNREYEQMGRKVEKYLLKQYSILCDVTIK